MSFLRTKYSGGATGDDITSRVLVVIRKKWSVKLAEAVTSFRKKWVVENMMRADSIPIWCYVWLELKDWGSSSSFNFGLVQSL